MASILIAEDDRDIRELVAFRLRRDGHEVSLAEDGLQAVDLVHALEPDLVILDVMMPGLNGLEVARAIRESPDQSDVPIIMLTARTLEGDIAQGFSAGADDYVAKPFSPLELSLRVSAVLARSQ